MTRLIITNGDATVPIMEAAGLTQDARLCIWRDILHEGPLPDVDRAGFLDARAAFLAARMGLPEAPLRASLESREEMLGDLDRYSQVEIWLEHDLYDQLQLLEILSVIGDGIRSAPVAHVAAPEHLGLMTPDRMKAMTHHAIRMDQTHIDLARRVFAALTAETPESVAALVGEEDHWPLPFLKDALRRFLDELPDATGINRTERLALYGIKAGHGTPGRLFAFVNETDDPAFLGDTSFFEVLEGLARCAAPLVAGLDIPFSNALFEDDDSYRAFVRQAGLAVTPFGQSVLDGTADAVAENGIARWWGGTKLTGHECWRFDAATDRLFRA